MVDEGTTGQNEPAASPVGAARETQQPTPVAGVDAPAAPTDPGFMERGGLRRRLRFLRKTRELAYRDLGGLVFEMRRLGQQREDLLASKVATLQRIDTELRAIEETLRQRRGVTVLREAGVTACPRCAAIHGSEDRFCPACGFSMGSHAERPIGAPAPAQASHKPAGAPPTPPRPPVTSPATSQWPATAVPAAGPEPTPAGPPPPRAPIVVPATPPRPPVAAPTSPAPAQSAKPLQPAPRPTAPPREEDQPTQVIEPPTQIVRPNQDEPNTEKKSNRA
jgi:hypothetical protein